MPRPLLLMFVLAASGFQLDVTRRWGIASDWLEGNPSVMASQADPSPPCARHWSEHSCRGSRSSSCSGPLL
jgi:hypothetical protein